jgi:hypothetical protein
VDVMRRAGTPMTAREIADALVADKAPQATRKQAMDFEHMVRCGERRRLALSNGAIAAYERLRAESLAA